MDVSKPLLFALSSSPVRPIGATKALHQTAKHPPTHVPCRQRSSRHHFGCSKIVMCTGGAPQSQSTATAQQEGFDWDNQWYPVALEVDLDPLVPTPFVINGRRLVVWRARQPSAKWVVFRDSCPHRFAALSEGRIDPSTGNLQCGYHGWQFTGEGGTCALIPQAQDQSAASSPLACATQLPTCDQAGLVFVWLGHKLPSPTSRPAVLSGLRTKQLFSSMTRDLPFSFLTLLMNVLDPAHIHFAHHGQIGRRELAAPVPIRMFQLEKNPDDRSGLVTAFGADYYDGRVQVRFIPPCLVEIQTSSGDSFAYYSIPIDEFRVRTIGIQLRSRRLLRIPVLPRWIDHIRRNSLIDGDLTLMHSQEREMGLSAPKSSQFAVDGWKFFTPTSADRLIIELRNWLRRNPPPRSSPIDLSSLLRPVPRSDLLDRHESHVAHCSSCRAALRHVRQAIFYGRMLCILFLTAGVLAALGIHPHVDTTRTSFLLPITLALGTPSLSPHTTLVLGLCALACLGVVTGLRVLERRFLYVESARRLTHGT
jgi:phenylpropionate dioxygenase-like ring-hydroxylating dioxygenase large terminal subunit